MLFSELSHLCSFYFHEKLKFSASQFFLLFFLLTACNDISIFLVYPSTTDDSLPDHVQLLERLFSLPFAGQRTRRLETGFGRAGASIQTRHYEEETDGGTTPVEQTGSGKTQEGVVIGETESARFVKVHTFCLFCN